MQQAVISDLHRRTGYPSVTILVNTTPGQPFSGAQRTAIEQFIRTAERRLDGDVDDATRAAVVARLEGLLADAQDAPATQAWALCATTDFATAVRLTRPVVERVVIDATFATRDLVADLHRRTPFRVITVSEHMVRVLYGDQGALTERVDERWPLKRDEDQSLEQWMRAIARELEFEARLDDMPTVLAGVDRTVMRTIAAVEFVPIGIIPGNNDRSGWDQLFAAALPMVAAWSEAQQVEALAYLDGARSRRRYASGCDELWVLAHEGRIAHVVVEDGFRPSARIINGRMVPADDTEAPDVVDDVVDEIIEVVMRFGGRATIVTDGALGGDRIAAVVRY